MPKQIQWMYARKGCKTCQRAWDFLEPLGVAVRETVDARKDRRGPKEVKELLTKVATVSVAKGTKVVEFKLGKDGPDEETLMAHLIGPTGNLRAPAVIVGKHLYVGFHPDMYQEAFASG